MSIKITIRGTEKVLNEDGMNYKLLCSCMTSNILDLIFGHALSYCLKNLCNSSCNKFTERDAFLSFSSQVIKYIYRDHHYKFDCEYNEQTQEFVFNISFMIDQQNITQSALSIYMNPKSFVKKVFINLAIREKIWHLRKAKQSEYLSEEERYRNKCFINALKRDIKSLRALHIDVDKVAY